MRKHQKRRFLKAIAIFIVSFILTICLCFAVIWFTNQELAEAILDTVFSGQSWEGVVGVVIGTEPEDDLEVMDSDLDQISSAMAVVIEPTSTFTAEPSPTALPSATNVAATEIPSPTPAPTQTATLTLTPSPTTVLDLGIIPTPTIARAERTRNTYSYLSQSILIALGEIEAALGSINDANSNAIRETIQSIRTQLQLGDPLIFNLLITDRTHYDSYDDYTYFARGQEHIGNTDGILQFVIREDGIFVFFFGRDLFGPMVGTNSYQQLFRMGSPLVGYPRHPNGQIMTWSDNIEELMYQLTGNHGDLSIKLSLGRLVSAFELMFPNGVDLYFAEDFYIGENHNYQAGQTVHFTGDRFVNLMRQRKGDFSSYDRGSEALRRVLQEPTNVLNFVNAADPGSFLSALLNEDFGDEERSLTIQQDADDILLYQVFSLLQRENPDFAFDLTTTIASTYAAGEVHILTVPWVQASYPETVAGYREFVADALSN